MERKYLITGCLIGMFIILLVYVPITQTQTEKEYDPWADINDDGKIDVKDIYYLASIYGTTGDPTKNVNVTNWPTDEQGNLKVAIVPKIRKGVERIILLENFLGKIRFDANSWPELYFAFIPKGKLINITGVYCNIIYSSTGSWDGTEKRVDISINYGWSRHYYFWPTSENRVRNYDITDIANQIKQGINKAEINANIYSGEGTVYLNYWELIVEYYYQN